MAGNFIKQNSPENFNRGIQEAKTPSALWPDSKAQLTEAPPTHWASHVKVRQHSSPQDSSCLPLGTLGTLGTLRTLGTLGTAGSVWVSTQTSSTFFSPGSYLLETFLHDLDI